VVNDVNRHEPSALARTGSSRRTQISRSFEPGMDVMQWKAAWSAMWGVLAVIFGSAATAIWIAASTPKSRIPVWPAWILATVTIAVLYAGLACLAGRWPIGEEDEETVNAEFGAEPGSDRVRLWITNTGQTADFYVQVIAICDPVQAIAIRDPMGKKKASQYWTVPWIEDGSIKPRQIPSGATQGLDFARYDAGAVNLEISTGHSDANHWWFPAAPEPVGVRYYNLRSQEDLDLQHFILTMRIINVSSGEYLDRQVIVRIQNRELCCEITSAD
jgi:hypothetical protein